MFDERPDLGGDLLDAKVPVGERGKGARVLPALLATPAVGLATIVLPLRSGLRRAWARELTS